MSLPLVFAILSSKSLKVWIQFYACIVRGIETKIQHTVCFVFQLFEWKGIKISTKLILSYILGFCGFSIRLFFLVRLCSSFGCTDSATNAAAATGQTQKQRHQDPEDDKGDKCHHERSIGAVVG